MRRDTRMSASLEAAGGATIVRTFGMRRDTRMSASREAAGGATIVRTFGMRRDTRISRAPPTRPRDARTSRATNQAS
jgi:hypothetical protein